MAKVLIITGDAGEGLEIWYAIFRLREAGHTVQVAAKTRRTIRAVVHDFEAGFDAYTEKPGYQVPVDLTVAEANPAEYEAVVLPGGRAPEYLRDDPEVQRVVRAIAEAGKPVAAICHGPQILTTLGLLRGRRATAYPHLKSDLELAGATFVDAEVVVDGNYITSRGWPDLTGFLRELVAALEARGLGQDRARAAVGAGA